MTNDKQKKYIDDELIDWLVVENYLKKHINNIPNETMKVEKFTEGYSNQTYLLNFGDWEVVLRRPPFGIIPPRAHDMEREFNILEKLNPIFSSAPKPYLYCEDKNIMDKHFYVMEKKQGLVIDEKIPDYLGTSKIIGPLISEATLDTLVKLQSIDYIEAGLGKFGKPEGFLERQVNGWIKRYENSKTEQLSHVKELEKWLLANKPINEEVTIIHNDFKLNNLVFDKFDIRKVTGVLDWELSTIGDPLTDIGAAVVYWGQAGDPDMGISIVTDQPGFYSRREFIESYAKKSGRDVSEITYYVSFGFYKLAVILQQIYARWNMGELKENRFKHLNQSVSNLFEMANLTRRNQLL